MPEPRLQVSWFDVLYVLVVFWLPPSSFFTFLIWREVRRGREAMRRFKADAEASAAEGYPPPDPPTTDSLSP